ncbi:response regulator [Rhodobacteraceae bacterium RKSG542]|uniref:PAS-domain containing protein n=1 Tax=Pseudovibrio flavus TaxID=2529854 RepID=UPI0012BCF392|nr:PAS-domain containing protein [Pseudovibrio flavus]MTI16905.1 response regulator [Pseudovibrio flavus]
MEEKDKIREEHKELQQLNLLQSALDHLNQGFSVFDSDLKLVASNSILYELFDFPRELIQRGTHIKEFFRVNAERGEYGDGDIDEHIQLRIDRALKFEPHSIERVRPSGQVVLIQGGPLPQGGFVTTYTDVTLERQRQKHLEETVAERTRALKKSEDWLRLVTDTVPALICYIAPGPKYRFANTPYAMWFNQSPTSIIGKPVRDVTGDELFAVMEPHINEALAGHVVSYEYAKPDRRGNRTYMRSTLVPDRTKDGRILGCFVLSVDATELKESENRLLQSQRMEAVGVLTGGLAHDFNNLLSIIIGNAKQLTEKIDDPQVLAATVEKHLSPILHAGNRGAELTRRLLTFARGSSAEAVDTSLNDAVKGACDLIFSSLPKSIETTLALPDEKLFAKIDPVLFDNALVNLAINARDAMPEGGELSISMKQVEIGHRDAQSMSITPGDYALIECRDTGTGLSENEESRVFEPFYTTKTFGNGSGLGLSMVYGFATRSGGSAELKNRRKQGAVARIILPIAHPQGTASSPDNAVADDTLPNGNGELVILVEDEIDLAKVLIEQITSIGYSVLHCDSAEDALELARQTPQVQAVLSDIIMPDGMNGLELFETLSKEMPQIGVALMSGYHQAEPSRNAGLALKLEKPFELKQLAHVLKELTER